MNSTNNIKASAPATYKTALTNRFFCSIEKLLTHTSNKLGLSLAIYQK